MRVGVCSKAQEVYRVRRSAYPRGPELIARVPIRSVKVGDPAHEGTHRLHPDPGTRSKSQYRRGLYLPVGDEPGGRLEGG